MIKSYELFIVDSSMGLITNKTGKHINLNRFVAQDMYRYYFRVGFPFYCKEYGFCNILSSSFHHLGQVSKRWDSKDFMRCYA